MTLHVMEPDFTLRGEIVNASSVSFTREFAGNGAFSVCMHRSEADASGVRMGCVIFPVDAPEHAGIVEALTREEGADTVTASGVLLSGLLRRRIALPGEGSESTYGYDRIIADAESVMKHYVEVNAVAPADENRRMDCLILEENQHRGQDGVPWSARFEALDQLLMHISAHVDAGYAIVPDFAQKKFVFRYLTGRDRTGSDGQRVTFSLAMGNAQSVTYCADVRAQKTTAYVGGMGEDENREMYAVGTQAQGLERREMFADAGSASGADELSYEGERQLSQHGAASSLRCQVLDAGAMRYGRDWDVGDIVHVAGAGERMQLRITQVTQTMEAGRPRTLTVTFGAAQKGVTQLIRELQNARVR